jgi:hypothetical protein
MDGNSDTDNPPKIMKIDDDEEQHARLTSRNDNEEESGRELTRINSTTINQSHSVYDMFDVSARHLTNSGNR